MTSPVLSLTLLHRALSLPAPAKDIIFSSLSSDSRTITPGTCFIALTGEQSDGHNYIEKAIAAGATAIIHRKDFALPAQAQGKVISLSVVDTLAAYRAIAKVWRTEFLIPIVAVAGSAGKTTSKEFVAAVLRGKWRNVLQTQASQNGFQGIPATLMNLATRHEAAVIEVGIDEPHAMAEHLKIVAPTHGLLTSIGEEHLEKLVDLATVAKEEGFLFRSLAETNGTLCINCDDAAILEQSLQYKGGKRFYYSLEANAKIPTDGSHWQGTISPDKKFLSVEDVKNQSATRFPLPLPGKHNALNLLGAICMGYALGLSSAEIHIGLKSFTAPGGRSEVHIWRQTIRIYCDTYNANPLSMKTALAMLEKTPEGRTRGIRTWACLGDMLELGDNEEKFHRDLADNLEKFHVDQVLLCGPKMQWLAAELRTRNFKGSFQHLESSQAIAEQLIAKALPTDIILIKGSRGMRMEKVWETLQERG